MPRPWPRAGTAGNGLLDTAGLGKVEARAAWIHPRMIGITDGAEKIRSYFSIGEKFSVQPGAVKTGHRPAVEAKAARRQHEIGTLQRAVEHGGGADFFRLSRGTQTRPA